MIDYTQFFPFLKIYNDVFLLILKWIKSLKLESQLHLLENVSL
jgi:hypothetical protein